MKIILLKDIPKIGRRGDVKDVADGYAMNFVIPRGFGARATEAEIKKLEGAKSMAEVDKRIQENLLNKSLEEISAITMTIQEKANEKGHLFEGIGKERLVKEIEKSFGIRLEPEFIKLEKPIKELGQFIVPIETRDKKGKVKVIIAKML